MFGYTSYEILINLSIKPLNFQKQINLDSQLRLPLKIAHALILITNFINLTFEEVYIHVRIECMNDFQM